MIHSRGSDDTPPPSLLEVFQVREPLDFLHRDRIDADAVVDTAAEQDDVLSDTNPCQALTALLVQHSYAFSYGHPYVGRFSPPRCAFNAVTLNLTVTSKGRQFDRLGFVFLGDTEIFRTSTAEPTVDGIVWTYAKDVSPLSSLFRQPQKVIFDLGNLIDDTYTAAFNVTLTATFTHVEYAARHADFILPLSTRSSPSNRSSAFWIPRDSARTRVAFPQNVQRAMLTVTACGQADEEFWFGNVLSSDARTFPSIGAPMFGYSPFREVQIYIDGFLAGVVWPFPIVFTGGVVPGLWRPVVGLDAFDLRDHEIDITPWLALLCDGSELGHMVELRVVGITDDQKNPPPLSRRVGSSWVVSGKIFLWLDSPGSITTGTVLISLTPPPEIALSSVTTQNATGENETLSYSVHVRRELSISTTIATSSGPRAASWVQHLRYHNYGLFLDAGSTQRTRQLTNGVDEGTQGYEKGYYYPVDVNTSYTFDEGSGNFSIQGEIRRGLLLQSLASPLHVDHLHGFPTSKSSADTRSRRGRDGFQLQTFQNGSARYFAAPQAKLAYSWGSTQQDFGFARVEGIPATRDSPRATREAPEYYRRHVLATNGSVVEDEEWVGGRLGGRMSATVPQTDCSFPLRSVGQILGRGPRMRGDDA
ncbi:MAG: hypothetical protein M1817_006091 [Caeruleum heppii]|nr:MAG: hypothetical protein M1817_006091 [Caeruleum heppii]